MPKWLRQLIVLSPVPVVAYVIVQSDAPWWFWPGIAWVGLWAAVVLRRDDVD